MSFLSLPTELHLQIFPHLLPPYPPLPPTNPAPIADPNLGGCSKYPITSLRHNFIPRDTLLPIFRLLQALRPPNTIHPTPPYPTRAHSLRLFYTTLLATHLKTIITTLLLLTQRQDNTFDLKLLTKLWKHTVFFELPTSQLSASVENSIQGWRIWVDKLYATDFEEVEFWGTFFRVWDDEGVRTEVVEGDGRRLGVGVPEGGARCLFWECTDPSLCRPEREPRSNRRRWEEDGGRVRDRSVVERGLEEKAVEWMRRGLAGVLLVRRVRARGGGRLEDVEQEVWEEEGRVMGLEKGVGGKAFAGKVGKFVRDNLALFQDV